MSRSGFDRQDNFTRVADVTQNVLSNLGTPASLKPEAKYHTGPRCVLKVNGKLIGFAFAVSYTIQTDNTEVFTIDDYLPYELAPRSISVSGTLGMFVIPGRSSVSEGLQSNVLSFMMNKYISLEISDSATGTILFKTNKAVITGQQTSIQAEQMSITQLSWKAIGWQNETIPEEATEAGGIGRSFSGAVNSLFGK
jgi:hypothetical protein